MDADGPFLDDQDDEDPAVVEAREREAEVAQAVSAFLGLVDISPADTVLAARAVACVMSAVAGARSPIDPTPGMLSVPHLIESPLARAQMADASPPARELLGELEVALVGRSAEECAAVADRVRSAVRAADRRLAR